MGVIKNNKITNNKFSKALLCKSLARFKKLGLGVVLINCLTILPSNAAAKVELVNIFLSDSGSMIFETKDKKVIQNFELLKSDSKNYKLVLNDSKASRKLIEDFNQTHQNYKIKNEIIKESFFEKQNKVSIDVKCLNNCNAQFEPLLGGLAYKLSLDSSVIQQQKESVIEVLGVQKSIEKESLVFKSVTDVVDSAIIDIELEDKDFKLPALENVLSTEKPFHMLKANKKDRFLFALTKENSPVEDFLDELDDNVVQKLLLEENFQINNIAKADSASLGFIADKLNKGGRIDLSATAYARALEVDPSNLNAMLGLARTTQNEEEKLHYYLKALDNEALLSIGKKWFEKGMKSGNTKQLAQAMVSYQFAVLKNPENPYYRFEYAKALEESGFSNFDLASKRYLEAALLAKKDFNSGDLAKESILRESTECLIKVLTKKGSPGQAVHYCNSYLGLGFKNFLDGRSIKGVMKEISSNKNPFQV